MRTTELPGPGRGSLLSNHLLIHIAAGCGIVLLFAGPAPVLSVSPELAQGLFGALGNIGWFYVLGISLASGVVASLALGLHRLEPRYAWTILILQLPAAMVALFAQARGLAPRSLGFGPYAEPFVLGVIFVCTLSGVAALALRHAVAEVRRSVS